MRCLKLLDGKGWVKERQCRDSSSSSSFDSEMEIDFPRICTPIASVATEIQDLGIGDIRCDAFHAG